MKDADTHSPDVTGFGGGGEEGAAEGTTGAAAECVSFASGGGISTCFQSCPSSTMRAIGVPRRTLRLPSSICKDSKTATNTVRGGGHKQNKFI